MDMDKIILETQKIKLSRKYIQNLAIKYKK